MQFFDVNAFYSANEVYHFAFEVYDSGELITNKS